MQALQGTIDSLRGIPCDNTSDAGAAGSSETNGGVVALANDGEVSGYAGDNPHQETKQGKEETPNDSMDNVKGAEGGEGWGDGEGDDYSEEEYEDSDIDETEEVDQEGESEKKRLLPAGGATASATSDRTSPGTNIGKNSIQDGVADGASVECDRDGRHKDDSQRAGNDKSKSGGGEVDPEASVSDPDHRASNAFATGNNTAESMSAVPVYLSGGEKVSFIPRAKTS